MTTEAKVGAFSLIGIILFGYILIHLSGIKFGEDTTYTVYVEFSQTMGINPSSEVRLSGVKVGKVDNISPDGMGVRMTLKLNHDVKVPRNSRFSVSANGVMGDKYISIKPDVNADMEDYLQDGDYVMGYDAPSMETMMENVNGTLLEVQSLLKNLNDIFGNPELKESITTMARNMRDATANLNVMSASLSRMAVDNETDVRLMAGNLRRMSESLSSAANGVDVLISDFSGDGTTAANLREAIANITVTSERIDHMAASLEDVVTDPQTADDLKATLHNTREVTERANNMLGKVSNIKVNTGVEALYSGKDDDWMTNMDLQVNMNPNDFFLVGVDDIGEDNGFNAQVGKRSSSFGGRVGVIDSKAGVGLDAYAGDKWKFSVDAYDPNDLTLKLRTQYEVLPDTYLVGQMQDANKSDERATYVGVRHDF